MTRHQPCAHTSVRVNISSERFYAVSLFLGEFSYVCHFCFLLLFIVVSFFPFYKYSGEINMSKAYAIGNSFGLRPHITTYQLIACSQPTCNKYEVRNTRTMPSDLATTFSLINWHRGLAGRRNHRNTTTNTSLAAISTAISIYLRALTNYVHTVNSLLYIVYRHKLST